MNLTLRDFRRVGNSLDELDELDALAVEEHVQGAPHQCPWGDVQEASRGRIARDDHSGKVCRDEGVRQQIDEGSEAILFVKDGAL